MASATEIQRFGSTPVTKVAPAFRQTSPTYIGLRVSRYGPPVTTIGTFVNGHTPTSFQRKSLSAQMFSVAPASNSATPVPISMPDGCNGNVTAIKGSCATRAINNPLGGRTRGFFFTIISVINVLLFQRGANVAKRCD